MPRILPQSQTLYQQNNMQTGSPRLVSQQAVPMAQGQEQNGARLLQAALNAGGQLAEIAARDYRQFQTAKVDDELLRMETEFSLWKEDYKQKNRGADALNAGRDFIAKHAELAGEARKRLNANSHEIFDRLMQRRSAERGLVAISEGFNYQKQQESAWQNNQWQGQLAQFNRLVEEHPKDWDAISMEAKNLIGSWQAKNKGLDPTALIHELDQSISKLRVNVLLEQKDFDGALAALNTGLFGNSYNGPQVNGRDPRLYRGGQICEDLNNPLNLKKAGAKGSGREAFEYFATPEDGFRGAWHQLKLYQNRGLDTPQKIINTWAPPSENDTRNYVQKVCARLGIAPDQKLDMTNLKDASRLMHAMGLEEGRLAARFTPEQIEAALKQNEGRANRMQLAPFADYSPETGGMPALVKAQTLRRIEAEREREQKRLEMEAHKNDWMVKDAIADWQAKAERGVIADLNIPDEVIRFVYGNGANKMLAHIDALGNFAMDVNKIYYMKPEQQLSLLNERKPEPESKNYAEKIKGYEALEKAVMANRKKRSENPIEYVCMIDNEVALAREALLQNVNRQTFSNYQAQMEGVMQSLGMEGAPMFDSQMQAALAARVNESENPARIMQAYEEAFGQSSPGAFREIFKSISPMVNLVAGDVDEQAARLVMQASRDRDFEKTKSDLIAAKNISKTDFDFALSQEIEDAYQSLLAAGDNTMANALKEGVGNLAIQHMARNPGLDYDDAITRAAEELINSRYATPAFNGRPCRIPAKRNNPDAIETGAQYLLDHIAAKDLDIEYARALSMEGQQAKLAKLIRNEGYWVTNEDESGLILYLDGHAVNANATPITRTWAQLEGMNKKTMRLEEPEEEEI